MPEIEIDTPRLIAFCVVAIAVTIAAITDIRQFKVYNLLTFPLAISGLVFHALTPWGEGVWFGLSGAVLGFGLLFLPFLSGGIGAGDLKLMLGIGAWLGVPLTLWVFLGSALAAGMYSIVVIVARGSVRDTMLRIQVLYYRFVCLSRYVGAEDRVEDLVLRPDCQARLIPFAPVICFATLLLMAVLVARI